MCKNMQPSEKYGELVESAQGVSPQRGTSVFYAIRAEQLSYEADRIAELVKTES